MYEFKPTGETLVPLGLLCLTLFTMDFFRAPHGCAGGGGGGGSKRSPLSKIFHTYPSMMKLGTGIPYLKKIQKIYELRDTLLEFCSYQVFFDGNQKI